MVLALAAAVYWEFSNVQSERWKTDYSTTVCSSALQAPNEAAVEFANPLDCEASVPPDSADRADDAARHVLIFRQLGAGAAEVIVDDSESDRAAVRAAGMTAMIQAKGLSYRPSSGLLGEDDSDESNFRVLVVNRDERFPFSDFIARVGSV